MTKAYEIRAEVSGHTALWSRPDSGDAVTTYPAPTRSAAKGLLESVLFLPSAVVVPTSVEICRPLVYHTYTSNYGGPLKKNGKSNFQLVATVLVNVCYRIHARIENYQGEASHLSDRARPWLGKNCAHAYQEMFEKRLKRGQLARMPCFGWQEFFADYFGPFRARTQVCADIDLALPSMLDSVFPVQNDPTVSPIFRQNLKIEKGVLTYAPRAL